MTIWLSPHATHWLQAISLIGLIIYFLIGYESDMILSFGKAAASNCLQFVRDSATDGINDKVHM